MLGSVRVTKGVWSVVLLRKWPKDRAKPILQGARSLGSLRMAAIIRSSFGVTFSFIS
jgi:hypothetical protein